MLYLCNLQFKKLMCLKIQNENLITYRKWYARLQVKHWKHKIMNRKQSIDAIIFSQLLTFTYCHKIINYLLTGDAFKSTYQAYPLHKLIFQTEPIEYHFG